MEPIQELTGEEIRQLDQIDRLGYTTNIICLNAALIWVADMVTLIYLVIVALFMFETLSLMLQPPLLDLSSAPPPAIVQLALRAPMLCILFSAVLGGTIWSVGRVLDQAKTYISLVTGSLNQLHLLLLTPPNGEYLTAGEERGYQILDNLDRRTTALHSETFSQVLLLESPPEFVLRTQIPASAPWGLEPTSGLTAVLMIMMSTALAWGAYNMALDVLQLSSFLSTQVGK